MLYIPSELKGERVYLNISEEIEAETVLLIELSNFIQAWNQLQGDNLVELKTRSYGERHQLSSNKSSYFQNARDAISEISIKIKARFEANSNLNTTSNFKEDIQKVILFLK